MNREQWLMTAVEKLTPIFRGAGLTVPELRVSCGFPSTGALATKKRRIGECWSGLCAADGKPQLFISPMLCDAATAGGVLATLVHEMIHAAIGTEAKHGPKFKKAMKQVGLGGKPTATVAGELLIERFAGILSELVVSYPHSELKVIKERKPQTTRMHKAECDCCGYTVRLAKKWAEMGAPICPVDKKSMTMEINDSGEE